MLTRSVFSLALAGRHFAVAALEDRNGADDAHHAGAAVAKLVGFVGRDIEDVAGREASFLACAVDDRWFALEKQPETGTTRYGDLLAQNIGAIPSRRDDIAGSDAELSTPFKSVTGATC